MNQAFLLLGVAAGTLIAQTSNFAGRYYLQNLREVGSELLLRPNGTFEFALAYGAADYSAKGTWRAQGGTVILNSTVGKDAPPFKLVRSTANPEPVIIVRVLGPNGRGIPNIDVLLGTSKGPLKARTDSSGDAEFPKADPAQTAAFSIRVYELETEPIKISPLHNEFVFEINGEAITSVSFKDERLTVSGKALIMRHWPDREMRYEKWQ
jgi:uncharacterized protein